MTRQIDDLQLDAELRRFLQLRVGDVARVRDAEAMSRVIAATASAGIGGRAIGRATWLVVAAALLAIAMIAAIGVGSLRQLAETGPTGTPANGLIAYDALTATSNVYLVRPGGTPRQITGDVPGAFAVSGVCPAFAPDGTMLAFGSADSTVAVVTIDGTGEATGVRRLADPDGSQHCPTWAPDSSSVAFIAGDALVVLPLDGPPTRIADWPGEVALNTFAVDYPGEHDVQWSPDGSTIAVARPSGTWLVPVDGGTPRRLDPTPARSVSWAPDGKRLVVSSGTTTGVIDAGGEGAPMRLPLSGVPVWSPSGDRIAGQGDQSSVVTVRPDGSDLRVIDDYGYAVSWSPDGERLLYVQDGGEGYVVLTAVADGSEQPVVVVPSVPIRCCRSYPSTDSLSWQPVYDSGPDQVYQATPGPTKAVPTPTPALVDASMVASSGWIAYVAGGSEVRNGPTDIWVVQRGLEPRRIAGSGRSDEPYGNLSRNVCPIFSPDGTQLLYATAARGREGDTPSWAHPEVVVIAVDAFDPERRVHEVVDTSEMPALPDTIGIPCPAWSPDGRSIAYVGADDSITISPIRSSSQAASSRRGRTLAYVPDAHPLRALAWSPDGSTIAVAAPTGLWLVPTSGGEPQLLRTGDHFSVSWSPEGSRLVVSHDPDPTFEYDLGSVRVIDPQGVAADVVLGDGGEASWSPAGDQIAFVREAGDVVEGSGLRLTASDLVTVRPDGSDAHVIAADVSSALWLPDVSSALWSPDGRYLLHPGTDGGVLVATPADGSGSAQVILYPSSSTLGVGISAESWQAVPDGAP